MSNSEKPQTYKLSDYLKTLKRTSLWQLFLFAIGFTTEWRLGVQETSSKGMLIDAFGVVWTDGLVWGLILWVIHWATKKWFPKVSAWCNRTSSSFFAWVPIAAVGFGISMFI